MDNLTHSLAGAILGQMGLKSKTGLAMPTLIIAANLPDIDAVAVLLGGHQHLALRRGLTHGPIAMLLLPVLLWAAMLAWDKWRPNEKRLPMHKGWLLALAYIGTISHPALDWLNVYGIRLLEPFSSRWFYGDTLFIIDIWIWAALAIGVWLSLRRERLGNGNWQQPAWLSFTAVCAYIFLNGVITGIAESAGQQLLESNFGGQPTVVASPVPVKFWERELLYRDRPQTDEVWLYGRGDFSIFGRARLFGSDKETGNPLFFTEQSTSSDVNSVIKLSPVTEEPKVQKFARYSSDFEPYIFWSRMPIVQIKGSKLVIRDQRFTDPRVADRFTLRIAEPKQ